MHQLYGSVLERLRGQFAKLLSRKRHVGSNPTASSMKTTKNDNDYDNDIIDDIENIWDDRNLESDEINIEFFVETDHIKLIN